MGERLVVARSMTPAALRYASRKGADSLLYQWDELSSEQRARAEEKPRLLYVEELERRRYDDAFFGNKGILKELAQKVPAFFHDAEGTPLLEAINKDLFWRTRREGMIRSYVEEVQERGGKVLHYRTWKDRLRPLKGWAMATVPLRGKHEKGRTEDAVAGKGRPYAFVVNTRFQAEYYGELLKELGEECCFFCIHPDAKGGAKKEVQDAFPELPVRVIPLPSKSAFSGKGGFLKEAWKRADGEWAAKVMKVRAELVRKLEWLDTLMESQGLKACFLAAQENTGFGNLIARKGKERGVLTVNTHNGIKFRDAFNGDNHFDVWGVWNERMKRVIEAQGGDPTSLHVIGHLEEDRVATYRYQGSFDHIISKADREKGVISIFSIPRKIPEKFEAVDLALKEFVPKGWKVLVRLHKSEDEGDWKTYEEYSGNGLRFVHSKDDGEYNRLYEQLAISAVTIVFPSTVALQSTWLGVPAISYEKRNESLFQDYLDEEWIFHAKEIASVRSLIEQLLDRKKESGQNVGYSSNSKKLAEIVREKVSLIEPTDQ